MRYVLKGLGLPSGHVGAVAFDLLPDLAVGSAAESFALAVDFDDRLMQPIRAHVVLGDRHTNLPCQTWTPLQVQPLHADMERAANPADIRVQQVDDDRENHKAKHGQQDSCYETVHFQRFLASHQMLIHPF